MLWPTDELEAGLDDAVIRRVVAAWRFVPRPRADGTSDRWWSITFTDGSSVDWTPQGVGAFLTGITATVEAYRLDDDGAA